ncbi:unnamed protein product [Sphagnum balticum]
MQAPLLGNSSLPAMARRQVAVVVHHSQVRGEGGVGGEIREEEVEAGEGKSSGTISPSSSSPEAGWSAAATLPTPPAVPRNSPTTLRHLTLDPDEKMARTRRISSSGAAKRFPKDFFKDDNCLMPIKNSKAKVKLPEAYFLDTFSKAPVLEQPHESKTDTPKFSHKGESKKVEYLSHKEVQQEEKGQYKSGVGGKEAEWQMGELALPLVSNFNVTLGKKASLTLLMRK